MDTYSAVEYYHSEHFPEPMYVEIECNQTEWEQIYNWLITNCVFEDSAYEPKTERFMLQFHTSIESETSIYYRKDENKWRLLNNSNIYVMFFDPEEKYRATTYDPEKKLM
ncbi:MAG: hypothetical protein HC836_25630 [Richelia sp. RM2_1_2]|nr:hypothetical protein [Richelia sp. RM2_1_2]